MFPADAPHGAPDGDSQRGEGVPAPHAGDGRERPLGQPVIEGLSGYIPAGYFSVNFSFI